MFSAVTNGNMVSSATAAAILTSNLWNAQRSLLVLKTNARRKTAESKQSNVIQI